MEEKNNNNIYKIIMTCILVAFVTFMLTTIFITNKYNEKGNIKFLPIGNNQNVSEVDQAIKQIRAVIDNAYIDLDSIDEQKLIDGAVKGYIEGLEDPYTEYMTAEEWADYQQQALGNYTGIGVYLLNDEENDQILILAPVPEGAAEKIGIKSKDIILKVDGIEYSGKQLSEASDALKGEIGSVVTVEILRGEEILTYEITREFIRTSPIIIEMLDDNIGYMKLDTFDAEIYKDFKAKLDKLISLGAKSLIIDVRFNGGGHIVGATDILDSLVGKNEILLIKDSALHGENILKSQIEQIYDLPIVLLQNEYSASATEIMAGALKDLDRAKIVGTTSYGKGVLQSVYNVGDAALKITTDSFYTPDRNEIHKKGIEPDYVVEIKEEYLNAYYIPKEDDKQLDKAIELLKK